MPGKAGQTAGKAGQTPGKAGQTPGKAGQTPGKAGQTLFLCLTDTDRVLLLALRDLCSNTGRNTFLAHLIRMQTLIIHTLLKIKIKGDNNKKAPETDEAIPSKKCSPAWQGWEGAFRFCPR